MKILLVCSAGMSTDILRGELIKYAKKHSENRALFVAEKERFELSNPVKGYTISNRARSTSYATSPSKNGIHF